MLKGVVKIHALASSSFCAGDGVGRLCVAVAGGTYVVVTAGFSSVWGG